MYGVFTTSIFRYPRVLLFFVLTSCAQDDTGRPADLLAGKPFPDANTLINLDSQSVTLRPDEGKLKIINVWATWCGPCRRELPSLEKLHDALDADRFSVVGLSVDENVQAVREYLATKGVTYENVLDPKGEWVIGEKLVQTFPTTWIVGRNGRVLAEIPGERVWHTTETVHALESAWRDGEPFLLE